MSKETKRELEHSVKYHQRKLEGATCLVSAGYHQDRLNEALVKLRSCND